MNQAALAFDPATHRYTVAEVVRPGITQVLKLTGFVDDSWFTDESRARGSAVHAACWYLAEGDLRWETVKHPEVLARVRAFESFLTTYQPKLILAESPLYSAAWGFCGTPDFLFEIPALGGHCIIEVKTGKSGLAAKLQTAAQKVLIEENTGMRDVKRFAFELSKEGRFKFVPHTDVMDKIMFLNALGFVHRRANEREITL